MAFSNSSLSLSICQYDNCGGFKVKDVSTDYGSSLTVNGNAVTSATFSIRSSSAAAYTAYDVTSAFTAAATANNQDDIEYTNDDSDVLDGLSVSDGIYYIKYDIVAGGVTYTTGDLTFYFICELECCINQMIAGIADYYNCTSCDREYINNTLAAYSMLLSLRYAMSVGNLANAQNIYNLLDSICDSSNCNCNN